MPAAVALPDHKADRFKAGGESWPLGPTATYPPRLMQIAVADEALHDAART